MPSGISGRTPTKTARIDRAHLWEFKDAISSDRESGHIAQIMDPRAVARLEAIKSKAPSLDVTPFYGHSKERAYLIDGHWYVREDGFAANQRIAWWKYTRKLPSPFQGDPHPKKPEPRLDTAKLLRSGAEKHWPTGQDAMWAPIGRHFKPGSSEFRGKITHEDTHKLLYAVLANKNKREAQSALLLAADYHDYFDSKDDAELVRSLALHRNEASSFARSTPRDRAAFLLGVAFEGEGASLNFEYRPLRASSIDALAKMKLANGAARKIADLAATWRRNLVRTGALSESSKVDVEVRTISRHGEIYGNVVYVDFQAKNGSYAAQLVTDARGKTLALERPKFRRAREDYCGTD
jgi:hypothetical protein